MKVFVFFLLLVPIVGATCIDNDHDGYGLGDCPFLGNDCWDYDAAAHPGAIEICNNKDDDCDGIVDNLNGYTNSEVTHCRCNGIKIPIEESCNGQDDDCDGTVDEGCTSISPTNPKPVATARVAQPASASSNLLVSLTVLVAVVGILTYVLFVFRNPSSPEDLASHYHQMGEMAYERGRFEKAKRYFERAADVRRRNI